MSFQIISAQSVSAESVKTLGPFVPGIWSQLFKHCECQEEGTRYVQAQFFSTQVLKFQTLANLEKVYFL